MAIICTFCSEQTRDYQNLNLNLNLYVKFYHEDSHDSIAKTIGILVMVFYIFCLILVVLTLIGGDYRKDKLKKG